MRRTVITLLVTLLALTLNAVPAKPGLWRSITLSDGTEVWARLCGDEHIHFWMSEDGQRYVKSGDAFVAVSKEMISQRAKTRRQQKAAARRQSPKKVEMGERTHFTGKKKGIFILVEYLDTKFKAANNLALYKRILNEEGFSQGSFKGSVADYFKAQSNGLFELEFDVVGPYTLKKNYAYYGQNDPKTGEDMHADEMVVEACQQADEAVNFADYDWDGDGFVDQVFVLYAGKGEADSYNANTIWPHEYGLSVTNMEMKLDGVTIDTYACSNEVDTRNNIAGIGVICHEFSHCLGYPDFYDLNYEGNFGMDEFDLMCSGSYNGGGFCPAGYTAHEKMMAGWQEPTVLKNDTVVDNVKPMSENGETFIIYNDAYPDEYYTIENRQKTGWDASYPARGVMVCYVDFDMEIWGYNIPNTLLSRFSEEVRYYGYPTNDHQRMTIFHADNDDDSKYWNSSAKYYKKTTTAYDLYPSKGNDSLTDTSAPAATLYHKNSKGKKVMQGGLLNIKQNADGTIGFTYKANNTTDDPTVKPDDGILFYESFDNCNGKGGNDGSWNGQVATSATNFIPDNDGWAALSDKWFGGDQCAKFGTSNVVGIVSTPDFAIDGTCTLTFKAAAWDSQKDGTELLVTANNAKVTPSVFTISKGEWTDCTATIEGYGTISLTFTPSLRFFLDEVRVVDNSTTTGMPQQAETAGRQPANRIYSLDGRVAGTSLSTLRPGIYIVNGKKYVK